MTRLEILRRRKAASLDSLAMIRVAHKYPETRKYLVPAIRKIALIEMISDDDDGILAGRQHGSRKDYGMTGPNRRGQGEWTPVKKDKCYYETGDPKDRCYMTINGAPGGGESKKKETTPTWAEYEKARWPDYWAEKGFGKEKSKTKSKSKKKKK